MFKDPHKGQGDISMFDCDMAIELLLLFNCKG